MNKQVIILLIIIYLCIESINAQIKGIVLDRFDNKSISDVSILLDNKVVGKTDSLGYFEISYHNLPVFLNIRHLSYKDTSFIVSEVSREIYNFYLTSKSKEIEEVVIQTGYQALGKQRITGAYSVISKEKLGQQVGIGITGMLPAIANSVMFNNNSNSRGSLMVRGLSSISANKQPLIILDNFPYEGNLDEINPLDVENVTVLKDAAATSIWGVRAGNGVIVITTKKGRFDQKNSFRLSSNLKIGIPTELNRLPSMSSLEFIELEEFLYEKGFYDSRLTGNSKLPVSPIVESLSKVSDGKLSDIDFLIQKERLSKINVRDQFLKYFYSNPTFSQNHIQASGGTSKFAWLSSFGFDKQISDTKSIQERINFRLNNQIHLSKRLNLFNDVSFISITNKAGNPAYGGMSVLSSSLYPYAQLADENGQSLELKKRNFNYLDQIDEERKLLNWRYNPIEDQKQLQDVNRQWILNFNTGLNLKLIKTVNFEFKYNLVLDKSGTERLYGVDSYYTRDLINTFTQISSNGSISYPIPKGAILLKSVGERIVHNARAQINYDQSFGSHSLYGILGFEGRINGNEGHSFMNYGFNPSNLSFSFVDFTRSYNEIVTGGQDFIPSGQSLTSTDLRFISLYSNLVYSYKNRLNFSGSLRRDATNLLGVRTNDRWNLLWSIGASYNVLKESKSFIDRLKLRSTYGFSGNVDPNLTSVTTIRFRGTNINTQYPNAEFDKYANPDLKWESVGTLNLGLDAGFFKERLTISFDYFKKKASDLYGPDEMDPTAGISLNIIKNVAEISASGIDLDLNIHTIKRANFDLNLQFNISQNKDRVVQYYLKNKRGFSFIMPRIISAIEGNPVYGVYSYESRGLDNEGNPIGIVDGYISTDYRAILNTEIKDMQFAGPVLPAWFGSAGSTIRFKNLSLDFRLLYKLGHFVRTKSINYYKLFNQSITHSDYSNRWQKPGDELNTRVPSLVYPVNMNRELFNENTDYLVESGSHIRLQYIHLQYKLQNAFRTKSTTNLFLNADNLGVLWKKTKIPLDPDYEVDLNSFRPARQFSFGINFQF